MNNRNRIHCTAYVVMVLLCYSGSPAHAIRYELINEAAGDQNGHTLSGFIEFDTACGENCAVANITDFSFSVSGPSEYSYSYDEGDDVVFFPRTGFAFLDAGPRFLTIDYSGYGRLVLFDATNSRPFIVWDAIPPNVSLPFADGIALYASIGPDGSVIWDSAVVFDQPIAIGEVIPEPLTLTLVFTAFLAYGCRR